MAVADLSLTVGRGEIFGFLGPNGAGKTTSVKMLLGLLQPTAGSGQILGLPLGDREARARLGFLPEHFRFHEWMTGLEMLRFHGRLYGLGGHELRDRVHELLVRVDLVDAAQRRLSTYSKGMLQRVGLAQALLHRPALVFLDEPTSGLDPLGRILVREILGELRAAGTSVFLNSHLLGEVEATCDRVAFVREGSVVQESRLDDLPGSWTLSLTVGSIGEDVARGLEQFGEVLDVRANRIRMVVAEREVLRRVASYLVEHGVDLYGMESHRPSLEEVFLDLMGDGHRPG